MAPWLLRWAVRVRPREGWLAFVLAWLAILCLPAMAVDAQWLVGMEPGFWLATVALLLAWRLAHTRLHAGTAAGLLFLSGLLADLTWGVYVLNPGLVFAELWQHLIWWLRGSHGSIAPWAAAPAQWTALVEFAQRIGWWITGLVGKHGFPDNLVVAALALLLIWGAAAWAGWCIARRGRVFEALAPAFLLIALQAFVANRGLVWLLGLVSLLPPLAAIAHTRWLGNRWDAAGIDYSSEVNLSAALTGAAGMIIVMMATPALPFLTSRQVADFFWQRFQRPYSQVEQHLNQSFPAAAGARSLVPAGGVAAGGLPRAHLLGGRPELGNEIALRISVRGARPGDLLYWRGQTFDVYTGQGWEAGSEGIQVQSREAGQPWSEETLAARHSVLSFVDVYAAARSILYGPNEVVSADRPYQVRLRGAGNAVQFEIPRRPDSYTVLSAVPDLNPNALRAAGTEYPAEISRSYLQLPTNLPPSLAQYAARVTSGAATPYDAALAIEGALRRIPYSLDVPVPPAGREVASWFLFDLKRGYCDYYATAMVVLARQVGIPARLAIGYATGTVEPNTGKYRVTELQAHSWPELYFPHLGWIPFEPTASQPLPARNPAEVPAWLLAGGAPPPIPSADLGELRQRGAQNAAQEARLARLCLVLGILSGLLAAWTARQVWQPGSMGQAVGTAAGYVRLLGWGARLGRPALATDTPREYATALAAAAHLAAARARYGKAAAAHAANTVGADAERLALAYEQSEYAGGQVGGAGESAERIGLPGPPGFRTSRRAGESTAEDARLWRALRRLWLARISRI